MPEHPSEIVILAEDQEHQNLVWHYLKNCPKYKRKMRDVTKVALPGSRGCGSQYVREQFPKEVAACRERYLKPLLIVITDADNLSVVAREKELHEELLEIEQVLDDARQVLRDEALRNAYSRHLPS